MDKSNFIDRIWGYLHTISKKSEENNVQKTVRTQYHLNLRLKKFGMNLLAGGIILEQTLSPQCLVQFYYSLDKFSITYIRLKRSGSFQLFESHINKTFTSSASSVDNQLKKQFWMLRKIVDLSNTLYTIRLCILKSGSVWKNVHSN